MAAKWEAAGADWTGFMDVFKHAFETIIVGLLALPWLGVAAYLVFPDFMIDLLTKKIPALLKDNQASMGVAVLTLAYCLGAAIAPITNQLVNDEHWPLPENAIRCMVFTQYQEDQQEQRKAIGYSALPEDKDLLPEQLKPQHCSYWGRTFRKDHMGIGGRILRSVRLLAFPEEPDHVDDAKIERILILFEQRESAVLNQGSDKTEQLGLLHERIVVLRGAVFSGLVLLLICLFAYFARVPGYPSHWMRLRCGYLLAVWLTAFAMINGYQDLAHPHIFDIPVLEILMAVITVFGLVLVVKGAKTQLFRTKRYVLIALFFAGVTYGGWMMSEIIYDQKVMNSFAVLQNSPETAKH